jgi:hypothetical protein
MDHLYAVRDDVLPRLMSKCKPTFLSLDLAAHIAGGSTEAGGASSSAASASS